MKNDPYSVHKPGGTGQMKQRVVLVNKKNKRASTRKKHMWRDYEKRDINSSDIKYNHPSIRSSRKGKKGKRLVVTIRGRI